MKRRSTHAFIATVLAAGLLVLSACSSGKSEETPEQDDAAPSVTPLSEIDFSELEWIFRSGGQSAETMQLDFNDGEAEVDGMKFSLGQAEFADVNDDGLEDALVSVSLTDGNGFEEHWYLWVATEGDPIQITLPIARSARCGTAVESVRAVDGGFEVHEFRRNVDEEQLACAEQGTDERRRIVAAAELRNEGEWWPIQTAPFTAFGGLCPTAEDLHGYPLGSLAGEIFAAPDPNAPRFESTDSDKVFSVEGWPIYGEPFGGWRLVGMKQADQFGCVWVEAA